VAQIEVFAAEHAGAESDALLGLASLSIGEWDKSVGALERAAAAEPKNAEFLTDLSAAYLARGVGTNAQADLRNALTATDRALESNPQLLEARFNRALALEALRQWDAARAAWVDYLSRERSAQWRDEAQTHLDQLPRAPGVS
jgi:tetratricopeptide (TPR) repeat protein